MSPGVMIFACSMLLYASGTVSGQQSRRTSLGFLGLHGGVFQQIEEAASGLDIEVEALDQAFSGHGALPDISGNDIVLLQHLRNEKRELYRAAFVQAKLANPDLILLSISGSAEQMFPDLAQQGIVEGDAQLTEYYRAAGVENLRRMLNYLLVSRCGRSGDPEAALPAPQEALYHPRHEGHFASADEFLAWSRTRDLHVPGMPCVVVTAHRIHRLSQQPRVVEALVDALERRGILVVVAEDNSPEYREAVSALEPDAVLHTCHSFDDIVFRERLDVPHLHSIFFRRPSIDEWEQYGGDLGASDMAFQVTSQELLGAIEPQIGAGTLHGIGGVEPFEPIAERIEHLADRTSAWMDLRRLPNAEKKVAIIYYNRGMGSADLMRGSATGMFLNAPRSLLKVLARMREDGYGISRQPHREEELLSWMLDSGHQIGVWAEDRLDRLARSGASVLLPVQTYERWLEQKLSDAQRADLQEHWGPPPGKIQVWKREDGARFFVLPQVRLGENVVLLPQPLRGEAHDTSLAHDRLVPPSHNYLATYFWLQEQFGADALIHFGTHGTEFLLPGRNAGLGPDDWPDLMLGDVPNITPWVINNLGESSPARRRAYAVLVDHLVPPSVDAGLSDGLLNLHDDLDKLAQIPEGSLKDRFLKSIAGQAESLRLDEDLHIELPADGILQDAQVHQLTSYLHQIQNETTPVSLHTFGEPPPRALVVPYLVTCLGSGFLDELATLFPDRLHDHHADGEDRGDSRERAEQALKLVIDEGLSAEDALLAVGARIGSGVWPEQILDGFELALRMVDGFAQSTQELDHLMAALEGHFVPPGPGNSPDRNPAVLPTGRNMYVMNPREVPARSSWQVGKELVEQLLARQLESTGHYPAKVGFTLNSFATFQDYGVMESQILYLLGVRPKWDDRNMVTDVELIPARELGRPRIDVFIAALSYYRDMLPSRMHLLDKAIRLVANFDERGNQVFQNSRRVAAELVQQGATPNDADRLSTARLFGYPPGQMGSAGYYYLVERSAEWDTREDLMSTYLDHVRFVYTEGLWGREAAAAYDGHIQGTEVILRSWSDRTRSPLSNKYDWYHGGSLSLAVQHLTGREPAFFLSDVRSPDSARIVAAEDALHTEYRVRLFNRKWIEGMMHQGYAGADQITTHVSNTMGWAIMRESAISDGTWEEIVDIFVRDRLQLGLREWFENTSPYALQELTEILLESIRKDLWDASAATRLELAREFAASVVRHGESGGMLGAENHALERFVERILHAAEADADVRAVLADYRSQRPSASRSGSPPKPSSVAAAPPETGEVTGQVLERSPAEPESQAGQDAKGLSVLFLGGLIAALLVVLGIFSRLGAPRA